jgi:tRNA(adenine34) deaminase
MVAKRRKQRAERKRLWVHTVTTVSTAPPPGLFTRDARTIARTLASKRVSPKGITSGLRMLLFFVNRAGRGLSARRRAELLRAKRLMQEMIARQREGARSRAPTGS